MSELPSFAVPPKKDGSRTRRYIAAAIIFLFVALIATQVFLHQTSVGSPRFVEGSFILWAASVAVILALLILGTILGRNLIKLYFERKSGQVGSRFKTRTVRTFVALSLLPAVLLLLLSYWLMNFSINRWFGAPAEDMMERSRAIAQQYYEETREQSRFFAAEIASGLPSDEMMRPEAHGRLVQKLGEACRQYRLSSVRVFDERGRLAAESGQGISLPEHDAAVKTLLSHAGQGLIDSTVGKLNPNDPLNEVVWGAAPIHDRAGRIAGRILTEYVRSNRLQFKLDSVIEDYNAYTQLQRGKGQLRFGLLFILIISTLLIIFAFSWFAMYLAKRITVPIKALAEGAAAVAAGNLGYRVTCDAVDELGSLVSSFNRMTADLQENKNRIEATQSSLQHTNVELDNRRRYIEAILQTIATGVISLDRNFRIRTMNPAAMQMFDVQSFEREAPLDEVLKGPACVTLRALLQKSTVLGPVMRNIELSSFRKSLHLATTVTPLVDVAGERTGWVVVLDDVTELLRVEKMAAWQEVARRLAHEIKNPLTPIQLSAERVLRRYKQILPSARREGVQESSWQSEFLAFDNLLDECAKTIMQEAGSLKKLVDEFSRFARLPEARLEEADLHQVLDNALGLYNGRIHDVRLVKEYGTNVPRLQLDPEQMKRVFINLFDNALEAMADNPHEKVLRIETSCKGRQVRVEISDTGRGFPEEYRDSLFLPYFSTRKGGTGLGLAIVRQIVTDHHGLVRAEPNKPLGTRIIIDLPLAPA